MTTVLSWRMALKEFNDNRIKEGGRYVIPKKGSPEYASVRKLMGEHSDAVPLEPHQTITGQNKATATQQNQKHIQTSTLNKPLWVDEPKVIEKTSKTKKSTLKECEPDDNGKLVEISNKKSKNITKDSEPDQARQLSNKKSKKKSVSIQTEPASTPKSRDFVLELQ